MEKSDTPLAGMAHAAAEALKQRRQTLAVAESSAGGLINAALVAVPGASAYYLGGAIIYTGASRTGFLGIEPAGMRNIRSATEAMAQLLARRVREKLGATWGLAETGAAGPAGNRYGDAPGHACIAVSGPVEAVITVETGSAEREENMWTFARRALELLTASLGNASQEVGRA
jgi:PncC family amidohydrolase